MSCPDRNLAVFHHCRRYEGLRLLPSVCEKIIIQQPLIKVDILFFNKDMTLSKIITEIEQLDAEQLSENYEKFECIFNEFTRLVAAPIEFSLASY